MVVNCSEITSITGAVMVNLKKNRMAATTLLRFFQKEGIQRPTKFEGGEKQSLGFTEPGNTEQAGLSLLTTLSGEEAMEMRSIPRVSTDSGWR